MVEEAWRRLRGVVVAEFETSRIVLTHCRLQKRNNGNLANLLKLPQLLYYPIDNIIRWYTLLLLSRPINGITLGHSISDYNNQIIT